MIARWRVRALAAPRRLGSRWVPTRLRSRRRSGALSALPLANPRACVPPAAVGSCPRHLEAVQQPGLLGRELGVRQNARRMEFPQPRSWSATSGAAGAVSALGATSALGAASLR